MKAWRVYSKFPAVLKSNGNQMITFDAFAMRFPSNWDVSMDLELVRHWKYWAQKNALRTLFNFNFIDELNQQRKLLCAHRNHCVINLIELNLQYKSTVGFNFRTLYVKKEKIHHVITYSSFAYFHSKFVLIRLIPVLIDGICSHRSINRLNCNIFAVRIMWDVSLKATKCKVFFLLFFFGCKVFAWHISFFFQDKL